MVGTNGGCLCHLHFLRHCRIEEIVMTRLTDLSQEQKGMALAMKQAQNWRGRERVSSRLTFCLFIVWSLLCVGVGVWL